MIGLIVDLRHMEGRNLIIAVDKTPVCDHAAKIPHSVFFRVVQYRVIEVDPPAQTRAIILPRLVRIGLHRERYTFSPDRICSSTPSSPSIRAARDPGMQSPIAGRWLRPRLGPRLAIWVTQIYLISTLKIAVLSAKCRQR